MTNSCKFLLRVRKTHCSAIFFCILSDKIPVSHFSNRKSITLLRTRHSQEGPPLKAEKKFSFNAFYTRSPNLCILNIMKIYVNGLLPSVDTEVELNKLRKILFQEKGILTPLFPFIPLGGYLDKKDIPRELFNNLSPVTTEEFTTEKGVIYLKVDQEIEKLSTGVSPFPFISGKGIFTGISSHRETLPRPESRKISRWEWILLELESDAEEYLSCFSWKILWSLKKQKGSR